MARACLEDSVCARETPQLGRTAVEHRGEVPSTHVVAAADGNDCGEGWLAWWEEDVQELTVRALALPQHRLTAPVAAGSAVAASAEPHLLPQQWTLSPPRLLTQRSGSIASCLQRQWSTPQVKVEQQPGSPVGVLVGSAQLLSQQPLTPRAPQRKIQPFRLRCVWAVCGLMISITCLDRRISWISAHVQSVAYLQLGSNLLLFQ